MKRLVMLLIFSAIIRMGFSQITQDFLLGNYSYWRSSFKIGARQELLQYMQAAGFNNSVCEVTLSQDYQQLDGLLSDLHSAGIDATLIDMDWDNLASETKYTTHGLSLSNLQKFEADIARVMM